MSHPNHSAFSIEIPFNDPEAMKEFNEIMAKCNDAVVEYEQKLAAELGVSDSAARHITYLRGRSRWTQELEDRLVKADKAGHSVNTLSGEEDEFLRELGF